MKQTPKSAASNPLPGNGAASLRADATHDQGQDSMPVELASQVRAYGIVGINAQGAITSWNAGAERITGFAAGEVCGKHFSFLYAAAEVAAGHARQDLEAAANGEVCIERQCA